MRLTRSARVRWTLVKASGLALFLGLLSTGTSRADDDLSPQALAQMRAIAAEKASRTPTQLKIDSQLLYSAKMKAGLMVAAGVPKLEVLAPEQNGRLDVEINATVDERVIKQIVGTGGELLYSNKDYRSIRALVPHEALEGIAGLAQVTWIGPHLDPITNRPASPAPASAPASAGRPPAATRMANVRAALTSVLGQLGGRSPLVGLRQSEGDVAHNAAAARAAFGIDGTGVKIGVLSDGVTALATSQGLGDLGPVTVLPGQTGSGNEGTAMLELIHDLAPGAQLYFATAFTSITSFAQNIRDLRTAGCDIIVDDVYYFAETPFQDGQVAPVVSPNNCGVVLQAVNDVTASGAFYFSSAGNSGGLNSNSSGVWEGDFNNGGTFPIGGFPYVVHNFGGQTYDVLTTVGSNIFLTWSDPLGASANDYDLFRFDSTGTTLLAVGGNVQNGTQDPFEAISSGAVNGRIVIGKFSGADRFVRLQTNRGVLSKATAGQTSGHNHALNAYSVAAVPAFAMPPYSFSAANHIESFSSDGPRRLFYNADGTPITPGNFSATGGLVRQKPDIAAADGATVTGVGGFGNACLVPAANCAIFFGTSAAAPHAAAIAGLVKQLAPTITQAQMRQVLNASAIDIMGGGVDRDSGVGIIMADQAIRALPGLVGASMLYQSATATDTTGNLNTIVEPGECGQLSVVLKNVGISPATAISATLATTTPGVTITQPTSTYVDLAPGASASNATFFAFSLAGTVTCPLSISFTLTVSFTGGTSPQVVPFTVNTGLITIQGALDGTATLALPGVYATATGTFAARLARAFPWSTCASVKPTPGSSAAAGARYDTYTFNTCAGSAHPVTVTLHAAGPLGQNIYVAAYSPSFNPAAVTTNYLGDMGNQFLNAPVDGILCVNVPAGQSLVVVVNETAAGGAVDLPYTLTVDGTCVTCPPYPGLTMTKTDAPDPVAVGANLTYTITLTNPPAASPIATTTTMTDPLPAGTTFVSLASSGGWSCTTPAVGATGTVTCTKPTIAAGEVNTFTLVVKPCPEVACSITNTATVGCAASAQATTAVQVQSDLSISQVGAPEPVGAGGQVTYTITVNNAGPGNDAGPVVTDTLPAGWTVVSATPSQGSCSGVGSGAATCNLGPLGAAGQCATALPTSATITVVAQVPLLAGAGAYVNTASVATGNCQVDPNLANNTSNFTSTVVYQSDMTLTKIDTPDPVAPGRTISYSLVVINSGPSQAQLVRVVDNLPANSRFKVARPPVGWSCSSPYPGTAGGTVSCQAPTPLDPGTYTIGIDVQAPPVCGRNATVVNTATVSTVSTDPNPLNNTATASTLVLFEPCFGLRPAEKPQD